MAEFELPVAVYSSMKLSVGTQLATVTVSVLFVVTTLLVMVLASQERQQALESKQAAATMVTDLFASSASAGVVFKDPDAVKAMLDNLRATDAVVGAAVYEVEPHPPEQQATLIAHFGESSPPSLPAIMMRKTVVIDGVVERMVVTQNIIDGEGKTVGAARVTFSLTSEYKAAAKTRRDLALGGLAVMLVTALLLIGFTRHRLVRPLMQLMQTAKRIEEGGGDHSLKSSRASEDGNVVEVATLARALNNMGDAIADRERLLRAELQVAADLQISILPKLEQQEGAERMAAIMKPATEVGGDYYDVIPTDDGYWLGIGDVSGHGLGAGVVMLMIQSAVAALVSARPDISPCEVECAVNRVLYENIRKRMGRRDHATLSILRYHEDGRVRFAGAHEDIIVYRAETDTVDTFETPGTWVGAMKDVGGVTVESTLNLGPDDMLVLYTDGITEAKDPKNGEQFGLDRLIDVVREHAKRSSAASVCDAVATSIAKWTNKNIPADDVSIVVLKHPDVVTQALNMKIKNVNNKRLVIGDVGVGE